MNAADKLFRAHSGAPYQLARHLARVFAAQPSELKSAAIRWADLVSSLRPIPRVEEKVATYTLLLAASADYPVFQEWLREARRRTGTPSSEDAYDATLLEGMLFLWPHRADAAQYGAHLCGWSQAGPEHSAATCCAKMGLATALRAFPDVAYALVELHERNHQANGKPSLESSRLAIALLRRLEDRAPCHADDQIFAATSARTYLTNFFACSALRSLLGMGRPIPDQVWPEVERSLSGEQDETWYRSLALLIALPARQDEAIGLVATALRTHPDPVQFLTTLTDPSVSGGALFRGRGWKRSDAPRKLLPLARALLERRVWPTKAWATGFDRPFFDNFGEQGDDYETEHLYDRVRDALAEALLDRALDPAEDASVRQRAVRGLGLLAPKGDGALRALGKLYPDPSYKAEAKKAQAEARNRNRSSSFDPELAILDAWEHFIGKALET